MPYDLDRDDCNPPAISDKQLGKRVLSTGTASRAYFTLTGQFSTAVWSKYCDNMRLGVIGGVADCEKLVLGMAHDRWGLHCTRDGSNTPAPACKRKRDAGHVVACWLLARSLLLARVACSLAAGASSSTPGCATW